MLNAKIDYYEHTIDGDSDSDSTTTDDGHTASSPYSILPTDEDRETIINDALDELADIARENILEFKREDFDDKAVVGTWIDSYLCQYFSEIDPYSSNFSTTTAAEAAALNDVIDAYIRELYDDIFERFYDEIAPPRVSLATHAPSLPRLDDVTVQCFASKIQTLREKPQPEQRTTEWYSRRNNLITASAASKAFGTQASVNQLIYEKCKNYAPGGTMLEDSGGGGGGGGPMQGSVNSPLHWGQRYEPLTVMIYEHRNKTRLGEFGCIQHDTYPFIGASPDGINIDPTSAIYGRMVEIKNIVNREITGHPKEEYWIQTQIQMEVCDLDECDFVETRFKEYDSEAEYLAAAASSDSSCPNEKGVILWFQTAPALTQQGYVSPPIQLYEYAPIGVSLVEYERWEADMFAKHERLRSIWVRTIYWYLDQYSGVLVRRNRLWFQEAVPVLQKLWETVEEERKSGYEHRAPKRKTVGAGAASSSATTDENNIKIVKLNTTIIPEDSQEVTSTNMASLITHQHQHQQHSNKYRQNPNKGPSDVLIKCFKIDDLEIDDSKIEQ